MELNERAQPTDDPEGDSGPPRRPLDDSQLGFERQKQVRWFRPKVLVSTGQRVIISTALGDFLDKRELQRFVAPTVIDHGSGKGDTWIDYIADTGDGFNATYSVAWLAAQRQLRVEGLDETLPRPGLLVLGGDEVYPAAAPDEYDNRFRGPYMASFPYAAADNPTLLAIPGNHDWYDGLTNFTRLFCATKKKWIGARRTLQTHSYFAVQLPHDWWLWGIDIQFDAYIDDPQLDFFRKIAGNLSDNARVILCTGKPSWADVEGDPAAYRNLGYFVSEVIAPSKAKLFLSISGDAHHYARYDSADGSQMITAGGGGAFLHPTHHLDDPLNVPVDPVANTVKPYRLRCVYPGSSTSKRLSVGAMALPFRNKSFMLVPAVLYLLLGWATQFTARAQDARLEGPLDMTAQRFGWRDLLEGLFGSPVSLLLLVVVLGGLMGFAKPSANWSHGWQKVLAKPLMGVVHFALQVAVGVLLVGPVAIRIASVAEGFSFNMLLLVSLVALGAVFGSLTMGAYLAVCCRWLRAHGNEAFSAMAHTGYKNFLRIHIGPDGVLTVYPIGLRRSTKKWRFDPENEDHEAPWLAPEPAKEPQARLIEPPVVIDPRRTH